MKFLCVTCDRQMTSVETSAPGDGTLSVRFRCPDCRREFAMLTNPMETQMVNSLCVDMEGAARRPQPLESVRTHLASGGAERLRDEETSAQPAWSDAAELRLARVPGFVRGLVRRAYSEWAQERGVPEITPELMDEARADLGLEGV